MKKRVYIAGPITGVEGYEENFNRAEAVLEALGFEPVNPISDGLVAGADYKFYIDRGLMRLMHCDAVCFLPGWNNSKGAKPEHHYAEICEVPMFRFCDAIQVTLDQEV